MQSQRKKLIHLIIFFGTVSLTTLLTYVVFNKFKLQPTDAQVISQTKNVVATEIMPYFFNDATHPEYIYRNPATRTMQATNNNITYDINSSLFTTVNELTWHDQNKAILTLGNLMREKRDFILDLSTWGPDAKIGQTELPFHGENYVWNSSGTAIAFFGNVSPATGTATLNIYDLATKSISQIDNLVFNGPLELLWNGSDQFFIVQESEGFNEQLMLTMVRKGSAGLWEKILISEKLFRLPQYSSSFEHLLLLDGQTVQLLNTTSLEMTNLSNINMFGDNFLVTFSPTNKVVVLYQVNTNFYIDNIPTTGNPRELTFFSNQTGLLTDFSKTPGVLNRYTVTFNNRDLYTLVLDD